MRPRQYLILMLLIGFLTVPVLLFAQDEESIPPACANDELLELILAFGDSGFAEKMAAVSQAVDAEEQLMILSAWQVVDEAFVNEIDPHLAPCVELILIGEAMALAFSQQAVIPSFVLFYDAQLANGEAKSNLQQMMRELGPNQVELMQTNYNAFAALARQLQSGESLSWLPACTEAQDAFAVALDEFEAAYAEQETALQAYLDEGVVEDDTYLVIFRLLVDLNAELVEGSGFCRELYARTNEITIRINNTFIALNIGSAFPEAAGSEDEEVFNRLHDYYDQLVEFYLSPDEA